MGTCFGYFKKKFKVKRQVNIHRCFYFHEKDKVEFELLVDGDLNTSIPLKSKWKDDSSENSSIYQDGETTQLLPLDAHSLLASRALQTRKISWSSTTPPSSIDLEWENEGGVNSSNIARVRSQLSTSSNAESSSGCAPGDSPTSLEWDPGTDGETEQLIREIEHLASKALEETGDWGDSPTAT
ncbi:uncharacterized protein [Halyomorpha halys]|uniref:uncharacterized protein isoform X2 n=1 Tax=Halyomorpha halys TaxID=286706 RepID=UPI0006D51413|nr:uncharacterized protein LOC106681292 [Halyomorpha halys]